MTFTVRRKRPSAAAPLRSIRVEPSLWAAIHAAAKARGLTASAYLRALASQDITHAQAYAPCGRVDDRGFDCRRAQPCPIHGPLEPT